MNLSDWGGVGAEVDEAVEGSMHLHPTPPRADENSAPRGASAYQQFITKIPQGQMEKLWPTGKSPVRAFAQNNHTIA
jgi:hypothetical protein